MKVAEPRPARSVSRMFDIAQQEVATLESDVYGGNALSVTVKEDGHKIFIGEELACYVVSHGIVWSAYARNRFDVAFRQHVERRVTA